MKLRNMKKAIVSFCLAAVLAVTELAVTVQPAQAAETFVYEDTDMIGQGGYIYFIRTNSDSGAASICRKNVSNATVSKVVTESAGIISLVVNGQYLYYTTAEDGDWVIKMCRLNGDDARTLCAGTVSYASDSCVYGMETLNNGRTRLFSMEYDADDITVIKSVKANQTLYYVKNIGTDSYYAIYNQKTNKISLYRLNTTNDRLVRIAVDKRPSNDSTGFLQVSDLKIVNGELYYDFGSYEGTGSYWYGSIRKLTTDGKKKIVAKSTGDDTLTIGTKELYYTTPEGNYYKYQLSTGKKSKYSLKLEQNISYTILGDKTYMADTSNAKKIVISRFKSGTNRETLTKNFITISFKQKKNISYTVDIRQVGIYNLVCVKGTDYSKASYGWRGKLTSVNWYITDGAGTLLGSFK